ncbi:MAG: aldehyde dehydrogenase family protein [Chloroflexi bacterium]|nr:MAG: aldehyde dehydrogenase family protein [Chloroflexota bacterium]
MTTPPSLRPLDGRYSLAGEPRPPVPEATLEVCSPVDGSVVGRVHEYTHSEIDAVVDACASAQPAWADAPLDERARLLHRFADLLEAHADELAELLVMEIAKARKDSRDEVIRSADFVRFTAEEAKRIIGDAQFSDAFPKQHRNKLAISYRVPMGTVLAIPPFNYPINLGVSKIAPALASGNAVVLKPPTQGALAGTLMGDLLHDAGIPPGVMHVVTGRGSRIGDHLVQHPRINMITFTGSSETGRALARKAGMVPLLLELGGKDAAIVLGDADLEVAAGDIVSGAFAYSGQRCTAVKRVLVVRSVAGELVSLLAERIGRLSVGDPRDDCVVTPLVDPESAVRAEQMVRQATELGASLVCGGGRRDNLVEPTLLDQVTEAMDVAWVEPFAPLLPVIRVGSAAEAVELSNRSEYGLQAAIFSRDVDVATQIALRLDVGTVQVNGRTARGPDHFPFIGTKSSGMGTQGVRYSIEAMTRMKSMVLNMRPLDLEAVR